MSDLTLTQVALAGLSDLYGKDADPSLIQFQKTRREFEGDQTLVVFPLLKLSGKKPEEMGSELGNYFREHHPDVVDFNVVKGFLNLTFSDDYWEKALQTTLQDAWWLGPKDRAHVMVEFSSPNTNKPLHLGHIRNNLLGWSVSEILEKSGRHVSRVNLVNDRGIHICKSMLAWQKWGKGETPASAGMKGDKLVGKYYVLFDRHLKTEIENRKAEGIEEEKAENEAPLMEEARDLLRRWEAGDPEVRQLWAAMNAWVYKGFEETYARLGVSFDQTQYESETYLLGKQKVEEALAKGLLYKKEDGSIWIDLEADGLDQKLLLRSDGTSVYMTQDIGTAIERFEKNKIDNLIYVVGNEQDYHFKALALILRKMGYEWASNIHHLSYGMVDLPSGKMKSREGTVVDADDLMDEVIETARQKTLELGKLEGISDAEARELFRIIGMGALKYFILKVDPKKKMLFNPEESIDFNGNTGPFIQYTHARIASVLRKAEEAGHIYGNAVSKGAGMDAKERSLIKTILQFPAILQAAGEGLSPALVANYVYELAREYNQFYHECPILKAGEERVVLWRLQVSKVVKHTLRDAMSLLGVEVPERM